MLTKIVHGIVVEYSIWDLPITAKPNCWISAVHCCCKNQKNKHHYIPTDACRCVLQMASAV